MTSLNGVLIIGSKLQATLKKAASLFPKVRPVQCCVYKDPTALPHVLLGTSHPDNKTFRKQLESLLNYFTLKCD